MLRSVADEKEEAASVSSSVMGEDILDELNGDGVGVEGVDVADGWSPDDVGAAGDS